MNQETQFGNWQIESIHSIISKFPRLKKQSRRAPLSHFEQSVNLLVFISDWPDGCRWTPSKKEHTIRSSHPTVASSVAKWPKQVLHNICILTCQCKVSGSLISKRVLAPKNHSPTEIQRISTQKGWRRSLGTKAYLPGFKKIWERHFGYCISTVQFQGGGRVSWPTDPT